MIPQEKSAAVARALRTAFEVSEPEDIRKMTKGHGFALVLRITVRGAPYLLRIIVRPNALISPEREFICMRAAAEAGLAPRIWYLNVEDGISITDFVEEVSFPRTDALTMMPGVLRKLHALAPFPAGVDAVNTSCTFLLTKGPALDGFLTSFQKNVLPREECEALFAWHQQVVQVYPQDAADRVSSHNDLFKPDNTLFDGRRVWLVDWEAAFLNDRYADLAVVANLIVTSEAEEASYLEAYFGRCPDEFQRARFFLMRQTVHMFYAMAFLLLSFASEPVDRPARIPGFAEFQQSMWAGEIDLTDKAARFIYGRVHWEQLVQKMRQTQWSDALRIVAERRKGT